MTIPANVAYEIAFLQSQIAAATPLANAPKATITALQLNADQLVSDIDTAVTTAAGQLDTWTAPVAALSIIAGVEALTGNAEDEAALTNMRGLVGRATSALNQM